MDSLLFLYGKTTDKQNHLAKCTLHDERKPYNYM